PDLRVVEGGTDGVLAERQSFGDVPLHACAGAPRRDVLDPRVEHTVPRAHAARTPHPLRDRMAVIVGSEVLVPEALLVHDTRQGVPKTGEPRMACRCHKVHQRGTSLDSGSSPNAAKPSQSAQTSLVAGCSDPQRASR